MELYKYLEELYLNNIPITLKSLVNTLYYSEEIIVFEDSDIGIEAAVKAGCNYIKVLW